MFTQITLLPVQGIERMVKREFALPHAEGLCGNVLTVVTYIEILYTKIFNKESSDGLLEKTYLKMKRHSQKCKKK